MPIQGQAVQTGNRLLTPLIPPPAASSLDLETFKVSQHSTVCPETFNFPSLLTQKYWRDAQLCWTAGGKWYIFYIFLIQEGFECTYFTYLLTHYGMFFNALESTGCHCTSFWLTCMTWNHDRFLLVVICHSGHWKLIIGHHLSYVQGVILGIES